MRRWVEYQMARLATTSAFLLVIYSILPGYFQVLHLLFD